MLSEIVTSVSNYVRLQDVIGPLVGGLLGYFGAIHTSRSNEKIEREKREAADHEAREARRSLHADDLSQRFRTLMDGYEGRIRDLTHAVAEYEGRIRDLTQEVTELRRELTDLRRELTERRREDHDGTD